MKTQSEIKKRLQDYSNGTVDSPYRIKKPTSYDNRFGVMEVGAIDVDKSFHAQCFDLAKDYVLWLTDNELSLAGAGAADIPYANRFPSGWKIVQNEKDTVPLPGWIVIYKGGTYTEYGHVAIVYGDANLNTMKVIEQNWNGYANKKPTLRTDNYYQVLCFIAPPVLTEIKTNTVKKLKKAPKQKAPVKKQVHVNTIEVIDKEITQYNMDKRGRKPKGIVIHNDAGNSTGKQYYNSLIHASVNRLENGIAHSYIDKTSIWRAIPEDKIGWHTSNFIGNRDYYGIEVCQSYSASDKTFLANEQVAFQEAARLFKKWGLKPNRNTVRLHMEFVSTACPHRSMVLHTGFDPVKNGRPSQATMNKLKDYFIKQIRAYMDGKDPVAKVTKNKPASATTPATVKDKKGWKRNEFDTFYKAEKGIFTPSTDIITRYTGPFTLCPQAGILQVGDSVKYDEVMKQDGYVWIGYTAYDGKRVYCPIRTWNKKTDSMGSIWGKIK